ncbi:hypothetical protein QTP88_001371 [Uroleucon formosanum]
MPITRGNSLNKEFSPIGPTSNNDIMTVLLAFKSETLSSNKVLSNTMNKQFNELKVDLQLVSKQVTELKAANATLTNEVELLKGKVASLESINPTEHSQSLISQVLQEIYEHERCQSNLIFYGVPEATSPEATHLIEHDKHTIVKALEPLGNVVSVNLKLIRLGKSHSNFLRPVKVIFESKDIAMNLFAAYNIATRSRKPFPEDFRISRDRTSMQRKLLRSCYDDLDRRVRSGETNLRIVFVNGLPMVGSTFLKKRWRSSSSATQSKLTSSNSSEFPFISTNYPHTSISLDSTYYLCFKADSTINYYYKLNNKHKNTTVNTLNFNSQVNSHLSLNGFYQNCRGLRTKLSNLKCNVAGANFLFIVLTETWLNINIYDSELGFYNYNVYRCDRNSLTSKCSRGDGVLIAIHKSLYSKIISINDQSIEQLFVCFSINHVNFIVGSVYFPPCSPAVSYEAYAITVENLVNSYINHNFILCGDFNLPDINWSNDSHGLVNNVSNAFGSLLDLIFVNNNQFNVTDVHDPLVPEDRYHPALAIDYNPVFNLLPNNIHHSFFNFHKYLVNPKIFWKFMKKNNSTKDIPRTVHLNSVFSTNDKGVSDIFSKQFSSVYTQSRRDINETGSPQLFYNLPSNCFFDVYHIESGLSKLCSDKSIGPDGLSGEFLYALRSVLSYPLWLLFHKSLDEGIYPEILKLSTVILIFKSEDPTDVANYRPISILSHIAKPFGSLVLHSVKPSVNSMLIEEQHGFRTGRSTNTCNLVFSNYVFDAFKNSHQVDVIYTDFTKAFDRVDHTILMEVLFKLGFGEPLLSWFRSYLKDRKQIVDIHGV